ncbi:hypothetical protein [Rhizobium leucaenae]|nr:hypothetical protein [Rhizobium leucaenae]
MTPADARPPRAMMKSSNPLRQRFAGRLVRGGQRRKSVHAFFDILVEHSHNEIGAGRKMPAELDGRCIYFARTDEVPLPRQGAP